jgi:hypothetical protein
VIVNEINIKRFTVLKSENDAPIGSHCNRPEVLEVAAQSMKPKTRHAHVLDIFGHIQQAENGLDLLDVLRVYAFSVITLAVASLCAESSLSWHRLSL